MTTGAVLAGFIMGIVVSVIVVAILKRHKKL